MPTPHTPDPLADARKRGRSAYLLIAVFSALWGLAQLHGDGGGAAFVAYVLASILAIIVRHCLQPGGVEDLLQVFVQRRGKP